MKALWLFIILVVFCIYVLFGLYLTENAESLVQIILTWVIYTILWTTFINVFLLGYFWSILRTKNGPVGLKGPAGGRGIVGIKGQCSITESQKYCIQQINSYIDELYNDKTQQNILDQTLQTFPNTWLNTKINTMAGSNQYTVIVANLSLDNKPLYNIINYLKSIWMKWFDLLYDATSVPGEWFTDQFADENYTWAGGYDPFDEIKKYDVFYWGITRDFRPLKAELCRSPAKFPVPNRSLEPRLKIIESNDYKWLGNDHKSGIHGSASFWRPNPITMNNNTYYPVGDIMIADTNSYDKAYAWNTVKINGSETIMVNKADASDIGPRVVGDLTNGINSGNSSQVKRAGPVMRTILVGGDVRSPIGAQFNNKQYGGEDPIALYSMTCPDGYSDLGDIIASTGNAKDPIKDGTMKCIPNDCWEELPITNQQQPWERSGENYVLNDSFKSFDFNANPNYGYNLFRGHSGRQFRRIKQSCLTAPDNNDTPIIKEIEDKNSKLGIGWYGHPYKLDPKYSIFTFMGIVPEGLIVHQATGRRFYIIYCGIEDPNPFNVLDFNDHTQLYDNALQVDDNPVVAKVKSRPVYNGATTQQWNIKLQPDKKHLKLQNVFNNNYLYLGLDPLLGKSQFSTVGEYDLALINPYSPWSGLTPEQYNNGTNFTFISAMGTNLDIFDK